MRKIATSLALGLFLGVSLLAASSTEANESNKIPAKSITFSKDVAPILFKNCAQCHRADDIAPFSVLTYKAVRPWAKSIKEKVVTREMPPWHADPHYGRFENEARLSEAEIATIAAWVDGGAKEGDPKEMPRAPVASGTWEIGKPDVVLQMPEAFTLGAKGADDYIYFRVPTGFTEDKWIQAAEFRPGNKRVVHHAVVFIETPMMFKMARDEAQKSGQDVNNPKSVFQGQRSRWSYADGTVNRIKADAPVINDACAGNRNTGGGGAAATLLSAYAPGRNADTYPAGMAKLIPSGSNLIFQMHYAKTTGKVETDRTSIAFRFATGPVEKMVETMLVVNDLFSIPAGAENHEANACATTRRDIQLVNYMPHMHVRGKAMKYEVVLPDGKRETLLNVDRYNFNWQTLYKLKQPVAIPKGSRFIVTGWFDNSAKNKLNPDPTKVVRFGEPTYDEMLVGFIDYAREKPVERPIAKVPPQVLDAYVGEYSASLGPKFTISREGQTLYFQLPGQPALPALPESETKFFFKEIEGASVVFVKNEQGEVIEMQAEFGPQKIKARKLTKAAAGSER
jgi:hypothetical protein